MRPSHAPARASGRPHARRSARGAGVHAALMALLATLALTPGGALAAAPSPAPDPFPTIETWIDGTIEAPPDAPAGGKVLLGVTFWDVRDHKLFSIGGLVARVFPAKGHAGPSVAQLTSDAVGHATAQVTVPKGGIGRIEIDATGQQCTADGTCTDVYQPLRIAGTGPPPDAPIAQLVRATLLPITGDVVAGRPTKIAVELMPIGLWAPDALKLPPELQVVMSLVGGARLGSAPLQQDPPDSGQPYQGSIRVPQPGQVSLKPSFVDASGTTVAINSELGPIQVIGSGIRADGTSPRPSASAGPAAAPVPGDAASDAGPPWIPIALGVVLLLGLVLFLGEPLTRRLRHRDEDDRR